MLRKFVDDTKLRVTDPPDGCAAIQQDLDRVEKWTERNLINFNEGRYKALHLRRNNLKH